MISGFDREKLLRLAWFNLTCITLLAIITISSCSGNDSDRTTGRTLPGALLREAAGMPDTVSEEIRTIAEYENDIEDAIFGCMRLRGFNYFPNRVDGGKRADAFGSDLPAARYAEEFGFGIARGFIAGFVVVKGKEEEYLQSLNQAELEAYMIALYGEQALDPPGTETIKIGGCRGEAAASVAKPAWLKYADWLEASSKEYYDRLAADPRIIALNQEWTSCMQQAGFDVWGSVDDLVDSLIDEFGELSANFRPTKAFNSGKEFLDALDEESAAAYVTFQTKEIELAIASHKCSIVNEETEIAIMNELQAKILSTDAPD